MKKIVIALALLCVSCSVKPKECVIIGEVVDRPNSKVLYLTPDGTFAKDSQSIMEIQIVDGKFEAKIDASDPQLMALTFADEFQDGRFFDILFLNEADTVRFQLYPLDRCKENVVKGGELNKRYAFLSDEPILLFPTDELYAQMDTMDAHDLSDTPQARELWKQLKTARGDERDILFKMRDTMDLYVPAYDSIKMKVDDIVINERPKWFANQASENQSEAELAILAELLRGGIIYKRDISNLTQLISLYEDKFSQKFASNPMVAQLEELLCAYENIKVGGKYIDFTAPDFDGNMITLSDKIEGKVAVIDMWASWCGPCIRTSINMIPIYEKYKDRGFEIVGIARENNSVDAAKKVIEERKFPWTNLKELDDEGRVWYKYGISNAAGGVFLVDRDGTILLINPLATEVEAKLEEIFK